MQFAKDSFYVALRERLAAVNPSRTVTLNGATRPAVLVMENEFPGSTAQSPDAFYLEWGAAAVLVDHCGTRALMKMECTISYFTLGTCESEVDRGRSLAALDVELLRICEPPRTSKRDFSQSPSVDMGSSVFWSLPALADSTMQIPRAEVARPPAAGAQKRLATLSVFFFPEVNLS